MAIIKKETKYGLDLVLRGRALWPKLTKPDTKFDPDGVYSTQLVLDEADARELEELLAEVREQALEDEVKKALEKNPKLVAATVRKKLKVAALPIKELEDKETGEATGEQAVNCKLKAVGKSRDGEVYSRKVALFDAKGKPIKGASLEIWNGSILKVNVLVRPYTSPAFGIGATVQLKAVQIIELVAGGERGASGYGFGSEDGYEYGDDEAGYPGSPEEAFDSAADAAEADF